MLAAHGRIGERVKPVLEVNATHPLTAALAKRFKDGKDKALVDDAAWLMLDEARLVDGETLEDAPAFAAPSQGDGEGVGVRARSVRRRPRPWGVRRTAVWPTAMGRGYNGVSRTPRERRGPPSRIPILGEGKSSWRTPQVSKSFINGSR